METFSANKQDHSRAKKEVLEREENVLERQEKKKENVKKKKRCEYIKMNFIFFFPFIWLLNFYFYHFTDFFSFS